MFQRTGFALFERVGSERAASASYVHGRRRADAQNAFHFEGGEEGKERERGGGWVGVNGLRKRRRNTIITSPQIYEDREIEIFVPRQARRRQAAARPPRAVQNIFNYGIIICCLCRGECAPLLPAQIILI